MVGEPLLRAAIEAHALRPELAATPMLVDRRAAGAGRGLAFPV